MEKFAEKCYIFRRLGNVAETRQTIQSELSAILVSFIILFAISLSGENGEMEPGLCVCNRWRQGLPNSSNWNIGILYGVQMV